MAKKPTHHLHYKYVISIMGAIIVVLLTLYLLNVPFLLQYITFASTITSIILAILVIIFTYITNNILSQSVARLDKSVTDISRDSAFISENVSQVVQKITPIPGQITELKDKIEKSQEMPLIDKSAIVDEKVTDKKGKAQIQKLYEEMIKATSNSGLWALYMSKVAYENNRILNLNELSARLHYLDPQYAYGFLVATAISGFLNFDGDSREMEFSSLPKELAEKIEKRVLEKIAVDDKKPFEERFWANNKQLIDSYLSSE